MSKPGDGDIPQSIRALFVGDVSHLKSMEEVTGNSVDENDFRGPPKSFQNRMQDALGNDLRAIGEGLTGVDLLRARAEHLLAMAKMRNAKRE